MSVRLAVRAPARCRYAARLARREQAGSHASALAIRGKLWARHRRPHWYRGAAQAASHPLDWSRVLAEWGSNHRNHQGLKIPKAQVGSPCPPTAPLSRGGSS